MALNKFTQIGNSGFGTDTSINTTGIVTAASFSGDGSGITGITALGSGVVVQEEGSNVGTAQTINFIGTGVTATFSGGIASVEIATSGGGGGGGLSDVVSDTTPQLGGNLDLNSNNITGTGDISITGDATFSGDLDVDGHVNLDNVSIAGVSTFSGTTEVKNSQFRVTNSSVSGQYLQITQNGNSSLTLDKVGDGAFYIRGNNIYLQNDGNGETYAGFEANGKSYLNYDSSTKIETTSTGAIVTGTLVATATTATNVTVANEASDTECFVMFGVSATGDNAPKSSSSLKYNSSTGGLSAGSFIGDGSGLTGITASGSGVIVRDGGSLVGTAGTIDFGSNVSVSPISAGVVTVTAAAGSIPGISTAQTTQLNNLTVSGVSTFTGTINANNATLTGTLNIPATGTILRNNTSWIQAGSDVTHFAGSPGSSGGATIFKSYFDSISGSAEILRIGYGNGGNGAISIPNGTLSVGGISTFSSDVNVGSGVTVEPNGQATFTGIVSATTFSGSGASLTTLNASELDSGTIPDARFPATLPAVSGANLTNLPAPTPADTDVQVTFDVSSNGSSAYRITGPGYSGADDNPDIYLVRGQRYRFINGTGSSHPFRIQSDTSGTAYTDGVSGSQNGTQDFNVQHDAPVRLYYQCTIHSGMIGNIYIVGGSDWRMSDVATNANPDIFTLNNVGIGTDNPTTTLEVATSVDGEATLATFKNTSGGGTNETVDIKLGLENTVASDVILRAGKESNHSSGASADNFFAIHTTLDNTSSEKLRIRSDGDVIIGTNDLESQLGSRRRLAVCDTTNGALLHLRGQSPAIFFDQSGGNIGKIYLDSVDLAIYSNTPNSEGTERLRITSAGNVGIGTTFAQEKLHIHEGDVIIGQDAGNNTDIRNYIKFGRVSEPKAAIGFLNNKGNGRGDIIFMNNNDATNASFSDSDEVFRIDSNGYRSFSTQPYVLLRKDGTTTNITADTIVEFDSTVTSEGGMTVNASRSRITVPKAGKYAVFGAVAGTNTNVSVGDGWRLDLYRDGAVYANAYTYPINTTGASTGEEYTLQTSLIVPADANDYFEFKVASVGSARASVRYGYFCVYYLG